MPRKQSGLNMPFTILDAARRLYQAGMSEMQASTALGVNRMTFVRMLKDDGTFSYHSRVVEQATRCYDGGLCENLLYAHLAVVAAKAAYREVLDALEQRNTHNPQKSNTQLQKIRKGG